MSTRAVSSRAVMRMTVGMLSALLLLAAPGVAGARAASVGSGSGCTWTFPGSSGQPSGDVCITSGTYDTTGGSWSSVTISSGATLVVGSSAPCPGNGPTVLTLANGGTIQAGGVLSMVASNSCDEGGASGVVVGAGSQLVNQGEIDSQGGCAFTGCPGGARSIQGSVLNTGTLRANQCCGQILTMQGPGTFDNEGVVDIEGTSGIDVVAAASGQRLTFVNDDGGSITAASGSSFELDGGNAFKEGNGTTSGTVVVNGSPLSYTGTGASHIDVWNAVKLSGATAVGQTLELQAGSCPQISANVTLANSFTNAGSMIVDYTGSCGGTPSLTIASGKTLDNTGSFSSSVGFDLSGNTTNEGTWYVGPQTRLTYTSGSFTNKGQLTIDWSSNFWMNAGAGETFTNAGGSVNGLSNTNGAGNLYVDSGNTYVQGGGATTGTPPVLNGTTLRFAGGGAATLDVWGTTTLSGNIQKHQVLEVDNSGGFCQHPTPDITAATGFTNFGTIVSIGCNGQPALTVTSGTLTNAGTIEARDGLALHATVHNTGLLQADYQTTFTVDSLTNYSSATNTLTGGKYVAGTNANLAVAGADIHTNAANIEIDQGGHITDGSNDALRNLSSNSGTLTLGPSSGTNHVSGPLTNSGSLSIGANTFTVNGPFTQTSTGRLTALVTGSSSTGSQLAVNGAATFAGTLTLVAGAGYTPASGDSQSIVTYSTSSGAFTTVNGTSAATGLHFVLEYDPNAATVVVRATKIHVSPTSAAPGTTIKLTGAGFSPGETVALQLGTTALSPATASPSGTFTVNRTVPSIGAATYILSATGTTSDVAVHTHFTVS